MEIEGTDEVLIQPKNRIRGLIGVDGMGFWVAFGILSVLVIIFSVATIYIRSSNIPPSNYQTLLLPTQILTTPKISDQSIDSILPTVTTVRNSLKNEKVFKFIGYYSPYDGSQWEWENEKVTCHALIVNRGKSASDEKILDEYIQLAKSGNTINKFIFKDFHLNLDLSELSADALSILKNSNKVDEIELSLVKIESEERGVSTCYSFVKIVDIKPPTLEKNIDKAHPNPTSIPTIASNNPNTFIESQNVTLRGFYQGIVDDGWGEESKTICSGLVLTDGPKSIVTKYNMPVRESGIVTNEGLSNQLIIVDDIYLNTLEKQLFRQSTFNQQVELAIDIWNYDDLDIGTPICFTKYEVKSVKPLPR